MQQSDDKWLLKKQFKRIRVWVCVCAPVQVSVNIWLYEWENEKPEKSEPTLTDLSLVKPHEENIYFLWVSKKDEPWLFTI